MRILSMVGRKPYTAPNGLDDETEIQLSCAACHSIIAVKRSELAKVTSISNENDRTITCLVCDNDIAAPQVKEYNHGRERKARNGLIGF